MRHRVDAPAVAVSTRPRRQTPAARQLLVQLEGLRGTRAAPVDAARLASLVRPLAPTLRGPLLLDVLIGLRERGLWQVALALAQLLEASAPRPPSPSAARRHASRQQGGGRGDAARGGGAHLPTRLRSGTRRRSAARRRPSGCSTTASSSFTRRRSTTRTRRRCPRCCTRRSTRTRPATGTRGATSTSSSTTAVNSVSSHLQL